MPSLAEIFGDHVQVKAASDDTVSVETLTSKKIIGIYFSAHWCPPCRGFTPVLAEWYNKQKAGPQGDSFEIVFVSSDRDAPSFKEYFESMPWMAMPFEERDRKTAACSEFGVQGIPTLVFVDGTGKVVEKNGRAKVSGNEDLPF